tara:strand:- start:850 stop:3078 length:2229 start_codon:yes stop_codon:yes gene_type:complete
MNRDSKSLLAKLMASEDLHVEYSANAATASFDTENRVLTVPIFKEEMSVETTDLMLGHEVGHALYTPQGEIIEVLKKGGMYKNFVNIVEDARIEKMIQSKFPGLKPIFKNAYNELMDKNFFGTAGADINSYNFIDRLNLHFKAGIRAGVKFSDEEMTYVKRMENLRSWDEVISLSDDLYEYCKGKDDENKDDPSPSDSSENEEENDGEMNSNAPMESDSDDSGADEDEKSDKGETPGGDDENSESESDDGDGDEEESTSPSPGSDSDSDDEPADDTASKGGGKLGSSESVASELETKTQDVFEEAIKEKADVSGDVQDLSIPVDLPLKNVIVSTADIHVEIDKELKADDRLASMSHYVTEWKKFSLEQKSIVAYMVKEFEMRKSADEHRRTSVADTGMLNPNKLHAYKFSEDIFLKNAVVADGKNHGFLMYIDWSGSMRPQIEKTIEQLMLLAMFCKKANIPFDVFAFSNMWNKRDGDHNEPVRGRNTVALNNFNLLHLISSKVKMNEFNKSMAYLTYLKSCFTSDFYATTYASIPHKLQLGGTPLNEAVITACDMVAPFKKMHGLQIVNVVFLTDGAGHRLNNYYGSDGSSKGLSWGDTTYMTDPKTKKKIKMDRYESETKTFLEILKSRDCRVIGFFISNSGKRNLMSDLAHAGYTEFHYNRHSDETNDFWKKMLATGYGEIEMPGYDKYFVIKEMETNKQDLQIDEGMTKAKMKTAFIKHRKTKLNSKKMLSSFCEFVS